MSTTQGSDVGASISTKLTPYHSINIGSIIDLSMQMQVNTDQLFNGCAHIHVSAVDGYVWCLISDRHRLKKRNFSFLLLLHLPHCFSKTLETAKKIYSECNQIRHSHVFSCYPIHSL